VVLYQKKVIIQRNEVEAIKAQHQRELLQKTIEVEEQERERVAKNIHDDLGALISILRLNNSRTAKNIGNEEILEKIHLENNIILNKTSESVRQISKKLASPTLVKLGYVKALQEVCSRFNQTGEIMIEFDDQTNRHFEISPSKASQLFRASQEIINNIVKHAKAEHIRISLTSDENKTFITFSHDGEGISDEDVEALIQENKGLGLSSIRSRISIIEAKIAFSAPTDNISNITIIYYHDEAKNKISDSR
jgi:signal transduction histidine kinase